VDIVHLPGSVCHWDDRNRTCDSVPSASSLDSNRNLDTHGIGNSHRYSNRQTPQVFHDEHSGCHIYACLVCAVAGTYWVVRLASDVSQQEPMGELK